MEYYVYEHWRPDTNTCFMAVTGKKRAPFSEETIAKMKIAAKEREAKKRLFKEAI